MSLILIHISCTSFTEFPINAIIPETGTHTYYRAERDNVNVSRPGRYRVVNLQGLQMLGLSVKG